MGEIPDLEIWVWSWQNLYGDSKFVHLLPVTIISEKKTSPSHIHLNLGENMVGNWDQEPFLLLFSKKAHFCQSSL